MFFPGPPQVFMGFPFQVVFWAFLVFLNGGQTSVLKFSFFVCLEAVEPAARTVL